MRSAWEGEEDLVSSRWPVRPEQCRGFQDGPESLGQRTGQGSHPLYLHNLNVGPDGSPGSRSPGPDQGRPPRSTSHKPVQFCMFTCLGLPPEPSGSPTHAGPLTWRWARGTGRHPGRAQRPCSRARFHQCCTGGRPARPALP